MKTKDAAGLFLKSRITKGLSPDTIRWYAGILRAFTEANRSLPKSPGAIDDFISSCTAGDERRHGYYRALRAFYAFLNKRYNIPNVLKRTEAPKRRAKKPRPLTLDELDQVFSYPHTPKTRGILMFLIDTGARIGELAGLSPQDISNTPWGYIARISGKTGTRLVPISCQTFRAIEGHLPLGYSIYRLRRLVSAAFADARVKGSSINLRHSFATYWEGDEYTLQQIMGHAHFSTTQIYRHLRTEVISKQHREFTPLKMIYSTKRLNML